MSKRASFLLDARDRDLDRSVDAETWKGELLTCDKNSRTNKEQRLLHRAVGLLLVGHAGEIMLM